MNSKIKVIQYGLGPIGCRITQQLVQKNRFEIVGAIDFDPEKVGRNLGELSGLSEPLGVTVVKDPQKLFKEVKADAVLLTTASGLKNIFPQIKEIVSNGLNIVSTCEELVYPWLTAPELAAEIDNLAKKNKVSILSTGVNPGFLMDFLPVTLTGICRNVEGIRVERFQNAQIRRIPFQMKVGAGLSVEEFMKKVESKTLRHVGLTESLHMIAKTMGWELSKTEDIVEPFLADRDVTTPDFNISAGNALGVNQVGRGFIGDHEAITLTFRARIGEPEPCEKIIIEGEPTIEMVIKSGVNGDIATCSIVINSIPTILAAQPGLRTMVDIESIACFR